MFNIYYINYAKAYEIAMLQNNKIKTTQTKESTTDLQLEGEGNIGTKDLKKIPIIGNAIPDFSFDASAEGNKSWKVIDTVNVVSTKSVILKEIYNVAKNNVNLDKCQIGQLIKLNDITLTTMNEGDILAVKAIKSGIFNKVAIEGLGDVNITLLFEVLLKDCSYIFRGENVNKNQDILIKIPMQTENELESQYSISDLEIGKISVIGIYKGKYKYCEIYEKLSKLFLYTKEENNTKAEGNIEYETDDNDVEETINNKEYHYIDIIAIVQDINLK